MKPRLCSLDRLLEFSWEGKNISNVVSEWGDLAGGSKHQGYKLGPLLYVIHINDALSKTKMLHFQVIIYISVHF